MEKFLIFEKEFTRNTNNPGELYLTKVRTVFLNQDLVNSMKSVMQFKKKVIFEAEIYELFCNEKQWKIFPVEISDPECVRTFTLANLEKFKIKGFKFISETECKAVLDIRGNEFFSQVLQVPFQSTQEAYKEFNKLKLRELRLTKICKISK